MTAKPDGGPAPLSNSDLHGLADSTLRAHAAIKLCVPDSGLPWLDEMIRQAQHDRFAGQALAGGMVAIGQYNGPIKWDAFAADCYRAADAMLAASGGRDA